MSRFNYAKEKAEFDRKWANLVKEYRAAGMPEADIQAMHDYDYGIFKRRRSWATYETPFSELLPDDECIEEISIESPTISNDLIAEDTYALISANARFFWMNQIAITRIAHGSRLPSTALSRVSPARLCVGLASQQARRHALLPSMFAMRTSRVLANSSPMNPRRSIQQRKA